MKESYELYLEGLANEVQHILQCRRREHNFAIMDYVHVGLVQDKNDKLTCALILFSSVIKQRVRIITFSPNPLPDVPPQAHSFICSLDNTYTFDVYMVRAQ